MVISGSKALPPFTYLDQHGKPKGLLIDYWRAYSQQTGTRIRFHLVDWAGSIQQVRDGVANMHSGIYYSEARDKFLDYSEKRLLPIPGRLFVSQKLKANGLQDLGHIAVGVVAGGYSEAFMRKHHPEMTLQNFPNSKALVEAGFGEKILAFISDYPTTMYFMRSMGSPDQYRVLDTLYTLHMRAAVKEGNLALLEKIERGLEKVPDATIEALMKKWIWGIRITRVPSWLYPLLIVVGVLILLGGWMFHTMALRRQVRERTQELEQKMGQLEQTERKLRERTREREQKMVQLEQAERKLRESQARFRIAGELSYDLIYEWDVKSDELRWYNDIDTFLGYELGEISQDIGAWLALIHPKDQPSLEKAVYYHRTSTKAIQISYRIRQKDGRFRYWSDKGLPLLDESDKPYRWIGVCTDVTEHREMEDALKKERDKLARYLDLAGSVFVALDLHGVITMINRQGADLLQRPQEMLVGQRWTEVAIPEHQREVEQTYLTALLHGTAEASQEHNDSTIERSDGILRTIRWKSARIRHDQHMVMGLLLSGDDITKQLDLENQLRQAQKMEALGTLSGGIAHEFNNKLTIILGYTQILSDELAEQVKFSKDLQVIHTTSLQARDIVRKLLTFSRSQEGSFRPLMLDILCKDTLTMVSSIIPDNITIRHDIQLCKYPIFGDEIQIQQVLINLLNNAIQAMEGRHGEIFLALELLQEACGIPGHTPSAPCYALTVADEGPGISEEHLDRVFDPFFSTHPVNKGTGLGLSIVHGIMSGHNGTITVHNQNDNRVEASTKGKMASGASFQLRFPVWQENGPCLAGDELPLMEEQTHVGNILLIDDEEHIVHLMGKQLGSAGYVVKTYAHPLEAFNSFQENPVRYDAVVIDLGMPVMGGAEWIEKARALKPDLPVLVCTGYGPNHSFELPEDIPILAKPALPEELIRAVDELLAVRQNGE
ncbi:MAG: transporter substrate-binding domain-containing protein [Magnetococcales bacterium]|nr:transporter substrate-binding domain-containing protein [Magnetococcales bacterium]